MHWNRLYFVVAVLFISSAVSTTTTMGTMTTGPGPSVTTFGSTTVEIPSANMTTSGPGPFPNMTTSGPFPNMTTAGPFPNMTTSGPFTTTMMTTSGQTTGPMTTTGSGSTAATTTTTTTTTTSGSTTTVTAVPTGTDVPTGTYLPTPSGSRTRTPSSSYTPTPSNLKPPIIDVPFNKNADFIIELKFDSKVVSCPLNTWNQSFASDLIFLAGGNPDEWAAEPCPPASNRRRAADFIGRVSSSSTTLDAKSVRQLSSAISSSDLFKENGGTGASVNTSGSSVSSVICFSAILGALLGIFAL